jgi:hypothetical protein
MDGEGVSDHSYLKTFLWPDGKKYTGSYKMDLKVIVSMDSESLPTRMANSTRENGLEGTNMGEAKRHGLIKLRNGDNGRMERSKISY